MFHVYSTCIGLTNSWTRIQNNSGSTDKGWEADMKSLSWGMNVSVYLYIQSRAAVRNPDTTLEGFLSLHATNRGAFLPQRGRWKEGFSCCLFPVDVEGAIKRELRRELLFMTLKKNVLVHWDESEAFWKICVVIWGGKKYKWRQYLALHLPRFVSWLLSSNCCTWVN